MESNNSPEFKVKKATQELSGHNIELNQTREYLHCILQNSFDMIFATDVEGILVSFSKRGEKILGYSWGEIAGCPVKDFSEDPGSFDELRSISQEKGSARRSEFPFHNKKGD